MCAKYSTCLACKRPHTLTRGPQSLPGPRDRTAVVDLAFTRTTSQTLTTYVFAARCLEPTSCASPPPDGVSLPDSVQRSADSMPEMSGVLAIYVFATSVDLTAGVTQVSGYLSVQWLQSDQCRVDLQFRILVQYPSLADSLANKHNQTTFATYTGST